jgi:hypothetical protein
MRLTEEDCCKLCRRTTRHTLDEGHGLNSSQLPLIHTV